MRFSSLLHFTLGNLAERKARTATAVGVIAFAVGVVMLIAALALGFLRGALQKAEQAFPPSMLLVKPRTLNVSVLSFTPGKLGSDSMAKIRAIPGIDSASPQASLKMPLHATGEVMGQSAATDAIVAGVDPAIVLADVDPRFRFGYDEQTSLPVPVVMPRYFLDMYNLAYADSMGLPKINESFAMGKEFTLHLGESFLTGDAGNAAMRKMDVPCRIVGLTSNPSLFVGALIPLGHAEALNRWYLGDRTETYNAVHVKVADLARVDEVTSRILDLGYSVESNRETLQKFHFVARTAAVVTGLFAAAVVAIAAAGIFNTFSLLMAQRRGEVGLLRAVGGTRRVVTWLFVAEIAAIGLVGGVIGAGASWALLAWADRRLLAALPSVPFLPDHLFSVSAPLAIACITGACALSILAALPVILRTTRTEPAVLISEA
jgi:hypothetical protein